MSATATWFLTGSQNPYALAVEPGAADVDIPAEILAWAEQNGLSEDDPDVYILVTTEEFPGEVFGFMASMETDISDDDAASIAAAIEAMEAERAERRAEY